jgi:hypothetical protein
MIYMAFLFARIRKNNPIGVYLETSYGIHLVATGTIKITPEFPKKFDDPGIGITFDSIVWLYTWKMSFPSRVLLSDTGQIDNVERMLR